MKMLQTIWRLARSSGGYFLNQGMVSGGNFAITILLGRYLGPEAFGLFSLGWMAVLFVSSLQQALVITPMLSLFPGSKKNYLSGLARLQSLLAMVPMVLSLAVLLVLPAHSDFSLVRTLALPVGMASMGHQIYDFSRKALLVQEKLRTAQRLDGIVVGLQFGLVLILIGAGQLSPAITLYALSVVYLVPGLFVFVGLLATASGSDFKDVIHRHWMHGRWLGAAALLQWFSGNFFILAGGALLGTTAMGAIRMAQTIVGLLNVILLGLENFVPVRAAAILAEGDLAQMRRYLLQVGLKAAGLFFPVLLVIALAAPTLIGIVFGPDYVQFAFVLRGFAGLYSLVIAGTILRFYFRTTGSTREIFFGYVLSTVVSLLLAGPMVSAWGLSGIVTGLVLSQVLICGWLIYRIPSHSYSTSL